MAPTVTHEVVMKQRPVLPSHPPRPFGNHLPEDMEFVDWILKQVGVGLAVHRVTASGPNMGISPGYQTPLETHGA
eukprot:16527-Prorocentrum_minimum.AAC.3